MMKNTRLLLIIILLIAFLIHLSYLNNGFIWLDHGDIETGRTILSISKLSQAFFTRLGETKFYRPIVAILNSLDFYLFGINPWGYHLTNLLLFLLVYYSTYIFALNFFGLKQRESLFVALVAGIHPLSILPVGVISYRQELLAAAFTYLAVSAYIKARITEKSIPAVATAAFWLLAIFSKETALFWVPSFIFIREWTRDFKKIRQNLTSLVFLAVSSIGYLVLRAQAIPDYWKRHDSNLSLNQAVGTRLAVFLQRLWEIINPLRPSLSDSTAIRDTTTWQVWLTTSIIITCFIVVFKSGRKSLISRLILFTLFALIPSLSIIPLPRFSSPHYGFIAVPAAGVLAVLLWRIVTISPHRFARAAFILLVGVWLSTMAINTYVAGYRFKNDFTLFAPEVARNGNFREGHFYLGDYYLRRGDLKRAKSHLESSLIRDDQVIAFVDESAAKINLAGVYLSTGEIEKAENLLQEVTKEKSGSNRLRALYNLAVIAERKEDYQKIVNFLADELNNFQQPEPILLYTKGLVKTGKETEADKILRSKLLITDNQRRLEIIQKFR